MQTIYKPKTFTHAQVTIKTPFLNFEAAADFRRIKFQNKKKLVEILERIKEKRKEK